MISEVVDKSSKQAVLDARKKEELEYARQIDKAFSKGDAETAGRGCGVCSLFRRRRERVSITDNADHVDKLTTKSSAASRLFGIGKGKQQASDKLTMALHQMQLRSQSLSERAEASRKRVMELKASGKKEEALRELKRMKGLEKQAATASAAAEAIERQVDVLQESALQKEVAAALNASVKEVKAKSKGVLKAAENAVDDVAEVRDMAEDVSQVMEGLHPVNDADEDDLLAELEAMMDEGSTQHQTSNSIAEVGVTSSPASVAASSGPMPAAPVAPSELEEVDLDFPKPPKPLPFAKEEKLGLLSAP